MFFKPKDWKQWSSFLRQVRGFFDARGYLEVETPSLVPAGAFESSLDCLQVKGMSFKAELHTSPEIEMKVLMSELRTSIYQICRSFRDDPETPIHFKEFHMLEFYAPEKNYQYNMLLMKEFLSTLAGIELTFEAYTLKEAFQKFAGIELSESLEDLKKQIKEKQVIHFNENDNWNDLFYKLLIEKVEPGLNPKNPTFLYHYPPSQAALAALDDSQSYAERFEIYWKGIELCNGCTELSSLEELQSRFVFESSKRQTDKKTAHLFPERLKLAMEKMPPCSGVAVGLERLLMCLTES